MSTNSYVNLTEAIPAAVRSPGLPPYSGKCSQKTYTQYQHMTILLLWETLSTDYRDTVDFFDLLNQIKDLLQREQVLRYPTLHMSMIGVPSLFFAILLKKTLNHFYSVGEIVSITAMDSPGFTSAYTSHLLLLASRKNTDECLEELDRGGYYKQMIPCAKIA